MADTHILIIPGLNNSGPEHWQTLWEAKFAGCIRVEQRDWARPRREDWVAALDETIRAQPGPVILVAHSLGCLAVAHWAAARPAAGESSSTPERPRKTDAEAPGTIKAALLVAPPSMERPDANPDIARSFLPLPQTRLPFRSLLVASTNDPYSPFAYARGLAEAWGSEFIDVGGLGHINADANLRDWPQGQSLLRRLMLGR